MPIRTWIKIAGVCVAVALLGALLAGVRGPFEPLFGLRGDARAAPPKPDNPCNPNATRPGKAGNPCNPNAVKAGNPCNPNGTAAKTGNPCNPNAVKAGNPCNPNGTAAKAGNPCNPNAVKASLAQASTPGTAEAAPAPGAGMTGAMQPSMQSSSGGKIEWGRDFKSWDVVTGYVISNSHGNRLVQTYIYPNSAARIYKHNAELSRLRKTEGYEDFPVGTQIVQESWLRNDLGGPGKAGPVFFMRKQQAGYDPSGRDWSYGFTQNDLTLIGEGRDGKMAFCKECHTRADKRDFVFATER